MDTTQTPKLFYEDEFNIILRSYNKNHITNSKFCEIINDKADKIVSLNTELLEALSKVNNVLQTLTNNPCSPELMYIVNNAIKKATE